MHVTRLSGLLLCGEDDLNVSKSVCGSGDMTPLACACSHCTETTRWRTGPT